MAKQKAEERDFSSIPIHDLGRVDDPTNPERAGVPDVPSNGEIGVAPEVSE